MAQKIGVCRDPDCDSKGANHLLKDIEELCSGVLNTCKLECVSSHCGKGPIVEIISRSSTMSMSTGEKRKSFEGIDTFKKMDTLLKKNAGLKLDKKLLQVAECKFEARRSPDMPTRLEKIREAFAAIGGEVEGIRTDPKIAGELFLMRARDLLQHNPTSALADSGHAIVCLPQDGGARALSALALEKLGRFTDAYKTLVDAIDYQQNLDIDEVLLLQERLETKFKEEAEKETVEKKKADEQEAKRLKDEETKSKAADARRKLAEKKAEEARKKAEVEANRRKELEQKRKTDEEAAAKARSEAEAEAARLEAERQAAVEAEEAEKRAAAETAYKTAADAREEAERKYVEVQKQLETIADELKQRRERQIARRKEEEATLRYKLFACCRQERNGASSDCEGDAYPVKE